MCEMGVGTPRHVHYSKVKGTRVGRHTEELEERGRGRANCAQVPALVNVEQLAEPDGQVFGVRFLQLFPSLLPFRFDLSRGVPTLREQAAEIAQHDDGLAEMQGGLGHAGEDCSAAGPRGGGGEEQTRR